VADAARAATVLQLSDLHLLTEPGARLLGVDTTATLEAVLDAAFASGPVDAVFVTGDIAHEPDVTVYRRGAELLRRHFDGPVTWLPGNHDLADPMAAVLSRVRDVELGAWLVVGIDTHVDGEEGGFVAADELARLSSMLARSTASHVLVLGHHPCIDVGTPWLDGGRISNAGELLTILAADARVAGYGFGHIHHAREWFHAGRRLLSAPSTCFAFAQGGVHFGVEPAAPGCRRFRLASDGSLASSIVRADACVVTPDLSHFRSA
jgi:Icc protein